ncbi:MAG: DUF364 domain-containing protein [Anaerolineales bacterium]|jgi:uncharacterized protein (DUF4213/DUF364 family)
MSAPDAKQESQIVPKLIERLQDGEVREVRIGLHWTAVVAQVKGRFRCGLCSTLSGPHEHGPTPQVPKAGNLARMSGKDLAAHANPGNSPTMTSVGVAAINALLPPPPEELCFEVNAEDILASQGKDKRVVVVGHFPFIPRLREKVGRLDVLELRPREGDHEADAAPELLPQAEVVAITSMSLANHTFEELLGLCAPEAIVMMLGPSTPLSPMLFEHGVHLLSGSVVEAVGPVLDTISQGAHFRQVHRAGVRLVTMAPPSRAAG